ncbi:hypothetical protein PIB30_088740 [Stylosanthes scabra]|uniref:Uncharacterized protein n=1 Tax=Stylosanthes scabra TaxID=79078 RepID=A0ABU6TWP7_9FABA|nr:hypothetical protein [Stylosanthes scabra]
MKIAYMNVLNNMSTMSCFGCLFAFVIVVLFKFSLSIRIYELNVVNLSFVLYELKIFTFGLPFLAFFFLFCFKENVTRLFGQLWRLEPVFGEESDAANRDGATSIS